MAGTLTSSLIVRLIDGVTGPAKKISGALLGINNALPMSFQGKLQDAIQRNNAAMDRARVSMMENVALLYGMKSALAAPISTAVDFTTLLEDIGQKANMGGAELDALGKNIRQIWRDTNRTAQDVGKSVDFLIGMGASSKDALSMANPIGKAATAYRASAEDLAKASFAVADNLKVPVNEVSTALDIMAQAGKEGGFELRDMAGEFPNITAAAQAMGMKGTKSVADLTAALEVARKGTASGAEAANNMANFMQKIVSKETIKNMKKYGVNVPKEMAKAAKAGVSPIEHMLGIIDKITDGGKAEKIAEIFGDKQVVEFIRPMLANMKEYRRIRAEAMKAQGIVQADFDRRMKTAGAQIERFNASWENLKLSLGTALMPGLTDFLDKVGNVTDRLATWTEQNPELAASLVKATAALVSFRVAVGALQWVFFAGRGGILAGLLSLTRIAGMLVPALTAVGAAAATISAPVWGAIALAVAAVAAAGALLWKYWDRISSVLTGVAQALSEQLGPAFSMLKPLLAPATAVIEYMASVWTRLGNAISGAYNWVTTFFGSREVMSPEQKAKYQNAGYEITNMIINSVKAAGAALYQAGLELFDQLWAGMKAKFGEIQAWATSLPDRIGSSFKGFFSTGGSMPTVPSASNDNSQSGHRATGGPVWRGGSYLVGERGPEIFTPRTSGQITPTGGGGGPIHIGPFHISGGNDPAETARQVRDAIRDELRGLFRGAHADMGARA